MLQIIRDNKALKKNAIKFSYHIVDKLLYFDNNEKKFRLYVSLVFKIEIFKLTYNKIKYLEYARTHERLIKELYIFDITIKLYKFIRYYSNY